MIIVHQDNIGAFAGNHQQWWPGQFMFQTRISKIISAVQSLNLRIKIGSLVLVASGVVDQPTTGSDVPFVVEAEFVVRSIGASGKLSATGYYDNGQTRSLLANSGELTLDTTTPNDIAVSVQHGVASVSNIIKAQQIDIERAG